MAKTPELMEKEMINIVLNIGKGEKVEQHIHDSTSAVQKRVNKIGKRMVNTAQALVVKRYLSASESYKALSNTATVAHKNAIEAELTKWGQAYHRLDGDWTFVVNKSPQSKAFVTGVCPRKVFISDGMLEGLQLTDEELAMVIGHELSHVILGHTDEPIPDSLLRMQIVFMSLVSPIRIASIVFDLGLSQVRFWEEARQRRLHETEADELGLILVSLSCYDIKTASLLFHKFAELSPADKQTQLGDSHPSSKERYARLAEFALAHEQDRLSNPDYSQYNSSCSTYMQALRYVGLTV